MQVAPIYNTYSEQNPSFKGIYHNIKQSDIEKCGDAYVYGLEALTKSLDKLNKITKDENGETLYDLFISRSEDANLSGAAKKGLLGFKIEVNPRKTMDLRKFFKNIRKKPNTVIFYPNEKNATENTLPDLVSQAMDALTNNESLKTFTNLTEGAETVYQNSTQSLHDAYCTLDRKLMDIILAIKDRKEMGKEMKAFRNFYNS